MKGLSLMHETLKRLNDYVGALMLLATSAMVTATIVSYGNYQRMDQRVITLEDFTKRQVEINRSAEELAKIVAVLQDRQERQAQQ